jgi:cellulose synthase/poly-beta-1,6-N-acetylglucosamine synthase-like glycosyltransferase
MRTIFWVSVVLIVYVYAGYPLLLAAWARLVRRRPQTAAGVSSWPSISIVLAARNEGRRLPERIANLLQVAYPGPREVIVVSDGSTDDTAAAVESCGSGVRLIEIAAGGKPLALNAGVAAARGQVIVFADARQQFAPDALLRLVANFTDPQVGGVTGQLVLDVEESAGHPTPSAPPESTVGDGVGLYWTYEKLLRRNESLVWSTLGATGAIYAMRRHLWRPLPADALLDDVLAPMRVVLAGSRIVFEERARAFDRASADSATEWRRKVRTLAGNYQILVQEPRLLLPIANPVWLQYLSHKVGRLLVPWALVAAFGSSALLMFDGWFYGLAFAVQVAFYTLAAYGGWSEHRARGGSYTATLTEGAR